MRRGCGLGNRSLWIVATALLMALGPALAGGKPGKWDREALARKADYLFLEAGHRKAVDDNDAYYDLLRESRRLNPDDKLIQFDYGFYQIMVNGKDSAVVADGYALMHDYFEARPEDFYNTMMYGRISEMLGRADMARKVWGTLHTIFPDRTEVAMRYAESLSDSPDSLDQIHGMALYDSIETVEGKDVQLSNIKIRRFMERRDTAAVDGEIKELIEAFPRSAQVAAYAGDVRAALGDRDGALAYYRAACEADSTDGYAFYALANFYNSIGDSEAYEREIYNALRKKSLDLDTKLQIFKTFIENRDVAAAGDGLPADSVAADSASVTADGMKEARIDELFDVLTDEYAHEPAIYNFYASYLLTIPDYAGAAEQLSRSLDIDPADEQRWLALVGIDIQNNEAQDVERDALRAMRYFPDNSRLPVMLAAAYQQQQRYDEALDQLRRAESITDTTMTQELSAIKGVIGDIYYARGQKDDAFKYYSEAIELDPENWTALNNCAYYLACENRDLERALAMAKSAVSARPEEPTSLDTYAWVLFKLKRYAEAQEMMDRALAQIPEADRNGEELDHAGDIAFMNGDAAKALEFWKKALELDRDNDLLKRKVRHKTIFFE